MSTQGKQSVNTEDDILLTPEVLSPSSSNSGDEVSSTCSGPPPLALINAKNYITLTEVSTEFKCIAILLVCLISVVIPRIV